MLEEDARTRIRAAIEAAERNTDAEFVTVLMRQSDGYYFIPTLWAAVVALSIPPILLITNWWLEAIDIVVVQLLTFAVLTTLFRLSFVMYRLIPKRVLHHRAKNMAHRQFLEQGVHRTPEGFGVLFFVSEAEHYVELIADVGIDQKVQQAEWQAAVDAFTEDVRQGELERGFLSAIAAVGEILAREAPATHTKDQIPNHLIVIED